MKLGYARVSTDDQKLDLQKDALQKEGCERVFEDHFTGSQAQRPGLDEALSFARDGDILVVWRLDRLGRSLKNLIELVQLLDEKGIGLKSINESIDTSSSTGKLVFHIFASLAEFERNLIRERTVAGLEAARARGKNGGRPKALSPKEREKAVKLYFEKTLSVIEICDTWNITKPTLYKYINEYKLNHPEGAKNE